MTNHQSLRETAKEILIANDLGGYTIPTKGLYPFQWNWDSAITALGWMEFDEPRAWQEVDYLFLGQWDNGMIPHVLFHQESDTYFPGPDVWGSDKKIKSTSISQPPILASMILLMFEQAKDKKLALDKVTGYLPKLIEYHIWWYRDRDPENTGLIVSYHPWESGMDNSPAWDEALAAVPQVEWAYQRRDLNHIDAEQRPHKEQYDRYLYLVDCFKHNHFDSAAIYKKCPYRVNDIGLITTLHKATLDLMLLGKSIGYSDDRFEQLTNRLHLTEANISQLWCEEDNFFYSRDALTDKLAKHKTTAGFLTLYANLATKKQTELLQAEAKTWFNASQFSAASTIPTSELYEPQRYWRGPIWLHINWLIALGFEQHGYQDTAIKLKDDAMALIEQSGFYEYFHADSGAGCGGNYFSWTAAIGLYWLFDKA